MNPIRFEHIPDVGLSIKHQLSVPALSELLDEPNRELCYKAAQPAEVVFNLERSGKDVLLTGGGQFVLTHPCVRCLEPVEVKHDLVFDLKLEHPEVIDLEETLREELFLELPGYPACEASCLP